MALGHNLVSTMWLGSKWEASKPQISIERFMEAPWSNFLYGYEIQDENPKFSLFSRFFCGGNSLKYPKNWRDILDRFWGIQASHSLPRKTFPLVNNIHHVHYGFFKTYIWLLTTLDLFSEIFHVLPYIFKEGYFP